MCPIPQLEKLNGVEVIPFAETNYRGVRRKFGIKKDDRRRHMYLVGKTGMGKSTVMENMIIEDIRAGHGVGVIDPHGDLVEKILDFIPANRINDIIYVNPADMDWPIAFNVLESVDEKHKHLVASGLMGVFKKIWPDVWSARMEYIMNNTILALLDYPGSTMMGIQRMLSDKEFRKKVVDKITDPVVKMFWVEEFAKYNERFASEAIAPIQNKVGQFLSSTMIRNIVGQVKSTIDMREIMDNGKVFLLNLSKGRIGEDNARLLGGMIITKLQISAMERVDIPMEERRDFFLYVDEFQNFATESFASILSEARKYRLDLILAHQYLEQLDEKVLPAVFGNVGTIVCFRIGAQDAEFMEKEFMPKFEQTDLVNISKFNMYVRLMIDGVASEPFSATGLPPLKDEEKTGCLEKIIRSSRERYAKPRAIVEDKISRWTGMTGPTEEESAKPRKILPKSNIFDPQRDAPRPLVKVAPKILPEPELVKAPEIMSLTDALKQPPVGFKSMRPAQKVPTTMPVHPAASIQPLQKTPIIPSARPTAIVPPPIPKKPIKLFNQSPRPIEKKLMPKTVVKLIK
ncbi:MAG: type IV secretion system DNA-binding domain-containing protein [Patescibacteria group bacterium]